MKSEVLLELRRKRGEVFSVEVTDYMIQLVELDIIRDQEKK